VDLIAAAVAAFGSLKVDAMHSVVRVVDRSDGIEALAVVVEVEAAVALEGILQWIQHMG
jgi:hypothetical protein